MSLRVFPAYDQGLTVFPASSGETDPLAGVVFGYGRLQTQAYAGGPPLGLWEDEAATVPAGEFSLVAAWTDELTESGVIATQSNEDKRPMLVKENGVWLLEFDGVDDCLNHGEGAAAAGSIFAVAKHNAGLAYRMVAGYGGVTGGPHLYACLGPDPEWGGYYGTNVKADTSLASFKVVGTEVRAPNDVDFITNADAPVNRTNGFGYDGSNGRFIGAENGGTAAFMSGHIGAVLAGPATDYDYSLIRGYLAEVYADVLGT